MYKDFIFNIETMTDFGKGVFKKYPYTQYSNELRLDDEVYALFGYVSKIKDMNNDVLVEMIKLAEHLNTNLSGFNLTLEKFLSSFDEKLKETTKKYFEGLQASGQLDIVISNALKTGLQTVNTRLDSFEQSTTAQLAQKANQSSLDSTNTEIINFNNRVDKIISTPTTVSEQEIIDARQGKASLSTNLTAIKTTQETLRNIKTTPEKTSFVSVGKNKFDLTNRSKAGEWCNYKNGIIESTEYVLDFFRTYPCSVSVGETYTRLYGADGTVFFDKNMVYISGTLLNTYTVPNNAVLVIYNFKSNHLIEQVELGTTSTEYEYYHTIINHIKSNNAVLDSPTIINPIFEGYNPIFDDNVIKIGVGGDFATVTEGLEYAYVNEKEALILSGVYDIVAEGANLQSSGINVPKKIWGYGATIIADLPKENWLFSPLFMPYESNKDKEIYGLTIITSNSRYCIHDDLGSFSNYYHKFKDLTLINNGVISEILIMPGAIGGGLGSNGFIDIEDCIVSSNTPSNVDYHSDWQGIQDFDSVVKVKNSIFKTTITGTSIGANTSFKNKLYVSNCLCGTELPKLNSNANFEIKEWNNVIG